MNKILIFFVLCTIGLNAQSKLYPNVRPNVKLEQTIIDNTLSLADSDDIINKVFLYNKQTLERTIYENENKSIDINLDEVLTGLYTVMVYIKGDIIVLKVDVKPSVFNENVEPDEVAFQVKKKIIKHYRVILNVGNGLIISRYNVFTEKQKKELIRKNIFDLTTYTGRKNSLVIYTVYKDDSEELAYETKAPQDFGLFKNSKVLAKVD